MEILCRFEGLTRELSKLNNKYIRSQNVFVIFLHKTLNIKNWLPISKMSKFLLWPKYQRCAIRLKMSFTKWIANLKSNGFCCKLEITMQKSIASCMHYCIEFTNEILHVWQEIDGICERHVNITGFYNNVIVFLKTPYFYKGHL